jgi:hypothetical protein
VFDFYGNNCIIKEKVIMKELAYVSSAIAAFYGCWLAYSSKSPILWGLTIFFVLTIIAINLHEKEEEPCIDCWKRAIRRN